MPEFGAGEFTSTLLGCRASGVNDQDRLLGELHSAVGITKLASTNKVVAEEWHDMALPDGEVWECKVAGGSRSVGVARGSAYMDSRCMYVDVSARGTWHEVDAAGPRIGNGRVGWEE